MINLLTHGNITHKNGIPKTVVLFRVPLYFEMTAKPVNFPTDMGPGRRNLIKMKMGLTQSVFSFRLLALNSLIKRC